MKGYFHAFAMCQSMFCSIPCVWNVWDEKARDKMLLFLPVVGLEIGVLWSVLGWLLRRLAVPRLVMALILSVYPYLVTGLIHLDGYMDVTDAVGSCRSLQRRREILKDSHVGSFAVIGVVLLILTQFVLFASAAETADHRVLVWIPVTSRCACALAVTALRPMSTSQYAAQSKPKSHIAVLTVMMLVSLAAGFCLCGRYGFALLGCLAGYGGALWRGYRSLDGMNGDISGYALTIGELCGAAVYALI